MRLKLIFLVLFVAVFAALLAALFTSTTDTRSSAGIEPISLRIESLKNPIGLDTAVPRFSWKLKAVDTKAHNLSQSAYHVIVASSASKLSAGRGDVWDSGQIASKNFLDVTYKGPALESYTSYYWKVLVLDQNGKESKWSEPALWTTALFHSSDWSAKWIAAVPDRSAASEPLPTFRREFQLDKPIKQAIVYVSGLGQYELRLNGKNVTASVLNPGWTDYRKTVLYNSYDLTSQLHVGKNSFGVMLGSGMYDVPQIDGRYTKFAGSFGQLKLILQMHVTFVDGSQVKIVSDKNWKTTPGPIVFSSIYGGEDYDARREIAGWDSPNFNDSSWAGVSEVAGPNGDITHAGTGLAGRILTPIKVANGFDPVKITHPKPGIDVYDLGQNFSGWPTINVQGASGSVIKLTPAELLNSDGTVTQASGGAGPDNPVLFTYTLKGVGTEVWHPRFSYTGFRYVQVERESGHSSAVEKPVLLSLAGNSIHSSVGVDGEFSSTFPLFNQIHHLIARAILSNTMSVLTDCPTREKLGWLEQTHLAGASLMYNYDVAQLYEKMADDMADAQLPNGLVPSIAPEYVAFVRSDGTNTSYRDSPEWGSAIILSPWTAYQFYGDKEILVRHYDAMTRYLQYLNGRSKDHMLSYGLGDWYDIGPRRPGESQLTGKELTATAIYYEDLSVLAKIASILGKDSAADEYVAEAQVVKDSFNHKLFHAETNKYDLGSQTANAMPLVLGLVPEDRRSAVLDNLVEDIHKHNNHVTAGDIGFHYVVRALTDGGRSDLLYDMLSRRDSPSYGYQLAKGATTLTEAWDTNPKSSQNHFMLGHAEEWFYRGLAGIDFDMSRTSAQRILIHPAMAADLPDGSASFVSVFGTIKTSWKHTGAHWSFDLFIPPGGTSTVRLPVSSVWVSENGKPVDGGTLAKSQEEAGNVTVLVTGSGEYHFEVRP
jgi:alpha-L-rhamnosidase